MASKWFGTGKIVCSFGDCSEEHRYEDTAQPEWVAPYPLFYADFWLGRGFFRRIWMIPMAAKCMSIGICFLPFFVLYEKRSGQPSLVPLYAMLARLSYLTKSTKNICTNNQKIIHQYLFVVQNIYNFYFFC